ncbi:hypothetical protein EDC61_10117 [Sulfuritortus calidifontis]|uniref:Uncharacterized protein n=1 Tax=Sulfuritortus calidifontis TaxID=1914471 RepID=A0A4R3JYI5_9PROT|nr:hypothetical protein [Sulfuritortus calidifontis]TCS73795.1 hypothetical protein EDC61_10117 [Sulfuritortus calidifontis]
MTMSLYSTYHVWRREAEAERMEAAARRVIAPTAMARARNLVGMAANTEAASDDEALLGIG